MKSVLVTGGQGALGLAVASHLRSQGYAVICASRSLSRDEGSVKLDVTDSEQVAAALKSIKPSLIFHLAATYESDFDSAFTTNVKGAKNMLAAVEQIGSTTRVVLAGSAAEYGLVSAEENPIREDRLLHPVSTYGLTKSWQTSWGLLCAHQGQDVVIARIFNLDGSGLSVRLFLGRMDQQIREVHEGQRKRIEVGSLTAVRDYVAIEDAAYQLVAIAERGKTGQIYHVASGRPLQMRDLLARRLALQGLDFGIVNEHVSLSSRIGYDVPMIYADITKTHLLLNDMKNDSH